MHFIVDTSKPLYLLSFSCAKVAISNLCVCASFKDAQQRLEETHREKVTRVMKNWSDLEEKYQDMRLLNLNDAQQFKQEMTRRFQVPVDFCISVINWRS